MSKPKHPVPPEYEAVLLRHRNTQHPQQRKKIKCGRTELFACAMASPPPFNILLNFTLPCGMKLPNISLYRT